MAMLNSLALTDALLCLIAIWLASKNTLAVGYRIALTMLAIAALLGFLRFSGIYPLETWHPLFTLFSASAALPLLAICVLLPQSVVTKRKQFAIIFLGAAMLLGLLISGLGKLRIYDQALGLMSMLVILFAMIRRGEYLRAFGAALMLTGSVLFVLKVSLQPWLMPGDWLHLGLALGIMLVVSDAFEKRELSSAQENY